MQLHLGKLDLVQLMEQMLDEMTPSFVKNELQVEFLHAEHAIFLEADGELLARLFGNLLNNAVKYGKEGKIKHDRKERFPGFPGGNCNVK